MLSPAAVFVLGTLLELPLVQGRAQGLRVGSLLNPLSCWARKWRWPAMSAGVQSVCKCVRC